MPLFPIFIDLRDRPVLVVGGGAVAARKLEKLLPFGPRPTVVAVEVGPPMRALTERHPIELQERPFRDTDLDGRELVVVATDDVDLQARIAGVCAARRIPCNCADHVEQSSFVFPAVIARPDLVVGISTSGKAPAVAGGLRQRLEALLPAALDDIIDRVDRFRLSEQAPSMREVIAYSTELLDAARVLSAGDDAPPLKEARC